MNFNYKGWKINLSTIIRLEYRKFNSIPYPKLVVHEKYEKNITLILRLLALIGITSSLLTLSPLEGIMMSIAIGAIEQFFENTLFEYTVLLPYGFPDFDIDYSQWVEMGFAFPVTDNATLLVGPGYKDEEYAVMFFNYIKSWGEIDNDDPDNAIILSFVIEPDQHYTTYIYPNTNNSVISEKFDWMAEKVKYDKYGKQQQDFIAIPAYLKRLPFREGGYMDKFLRSQHNGAPFRFAPWAFQPDGSFKMLYGEGFIKYGYKFNHRRQLTVNDLEYHNKYPEY